MRSWAVTLALAAALSLGLLAARLELHKASALAATSSIQVGQVWKFRDAQDDQPSLFVVLAIYDEQLHGKVVHAGIPWRRCDRLAHFRFSHAAIEASAIELFRSGFDVTPHREAIDDLRWARSTVFAVTVGEFAAKEFSGSCP